MSFELTPEEMQSLNLSIWVSSEKWEFGKFVFLESSLTHVVGYANKVRFHKPPQNKIDPISFIQQSVVKMIDGIRGPIKDSEKASEEIFLLRVSEVRELLKSLRNDPGAILRQTILETDYLKVTQPLHSTLIVNLHQKKRVLMQPVYNKDIRGTLDRLQVDGYCDDIELDAETFDQSKCQLLHSDQDYTCKYITVTNEVDLEPAYIANPIGTLLIDIRDGESIQVDHGPDVNDTSKRFSLAINEARKWVVQHKLEEYISKTLAFKLGNVPSESCVIFQSSHLVISYFPIKQGS